jgi:hypothetical protein
MTRELGGIRVIRAGLAAQQAPSGQKSGGGSAGDQAAVAVANKVTRIVWAVWAHQRPFAADHRPD